MTGLDGVDDLVLANRALAYEEVLDSYGHVSLRQPGSDATFLMTVALAPETVTTDDVVVLGMDGEPVDDVGDRRLYSERFIHAAIYEARPDVAAVVHHHDVDVLPFTVARHEPLRPVIHSGATLGGPVPVWDIADTFGTATDLMVRSMEQGRSLAAALGSARAVLMRGHGGVVVGGHVQEVVVGAVSAKKNARVQLLATMLGGVQPLTDGEIEAHLRTAAALGPVGYGRAWERYRIRLGSS